MTIVDVKSSFQFKKLLCQLEMRRKERKISKAQHVRFKENEEQRI